MTVWWSRCVHIGKPSPISTQRRFFMGFRPDRRATALEGPFCPHRHATVPGPGSLVATPKPAKVKRDAPRSVTRIAEIEKTIALGNELLELRSKAKWNNEFG